MHTNVVQYATNIQPTVAAADDCLIRGGVQKKLLLMHDIVKLASFDLFAAHLYVTFTLFVYMPHLLQSNGHPAYLLFLIQRYSTGIYDENL